MEERDKIARFNIKAHRALSIQRDIFIFHCYIGCRVSDLYMLTKKNVNRDKYGTYIEYIPQKTKHSNPETIKLYLTDKAKKLIAKYNEPQSDALFPLICKQHYNKAIKEIFRICGITRTVTVRNPTTGMNEQKSIADIASSHIARKTFVGNLYKQVKDPDLIGKLSGHKEGSEAFRRYRSIDDQMLSELTKLL